MIFTDFYVNPRKGIESWKHYSSYSFIFIMVLIIVVNFIYMVGNLYFDIKRAILLKNLKKQAEAELEKR